MALRFAFVAALLGAVACGSGGGPLVTTTGGGREDPGPAGDTPPATRDNPTGVCMECDVTYRCTGPGVPSNGTTIQLRKSDGTCTDALVAVVCSGALFNAPACAGTGSGPFTCGPVTCTPEPSQGLPGGGGGGVPVDASVPVGG